MLKLCEFIQQEGRYLGQSIVKVDSFLNHQVDVALMNEIGKVFSDYFSAASDKPITKVLTAEASGIMPAMATASLLSCRMIYSRKTVSKTMVGDFYQADAVSRTRGDDITLRVNKNYLGASEHVLIIDDFLAAGSTIAAMADIVQQSGSTLAGIGTVIEKPQENGQIKLRQRQNIGHDLPILSLAQIQIENDNFTVSSGLA
jgi:xanthine phosphoribosyltransferase